jgi:hypothetical protein
VDEGAWDALVEAGTIARYQREGQVMRAYVVDLPAEGPLRFSYPLRARYPLSVSTPPSRVYPVGAPFRAAVRAPVRVVVE